MKRWIFWVLPVMVMGCTFTSKLSTDKAKQLALSDLRGGPVGAAIQPITTELEVRQLEEGQTAVARGDITVEATQPTYCNLGTKQLPGNRTVTLIRPALKPGQRREIPFTASYTRTDKGWEISTIDYGASVDEIGRPVSSFSLAVDISTGKGVKLQGLLTQYEQAVIQIQSQNQRLKRLLEIYKEAVLAPGSVYGYNELLQNLFPDEPNLATTLANAGAPQFVYVPVDIRWRARKKILDPVFDKNTDTSTAARTRAQQQIERITAELKTY